MQSRTQNKMQMHTALTRNGFVYYSSVDFVRINLLYGRAWGAYVERIMRSERNELVIMNTVGYKIFFFFSLQIFTFREMLELQKYSVGFVYNIQLVIKIIPREINIFYSLK